MVALPIKSLQHPIVKSLTLLRKSASARKGENEAVIIGVKMVQELGSAFPLKKLLVRSDLSPNDFPKAENTYLVDEAILKKISGLPQPEGALATLALPKPVDLSSKKRLLILDHISDPGNLGTLLRTAYALNYDGALLLGGVDPFNDKALRSAKGATFHLPLSTNFDDIKDFTLFAGSLDGTPIDQCDPHDPYAIIVSHESHGLSADLAKHAQRVTIPINPDVDSLNVAIAGGILLYALDPRRLH